MQPNHYDLLGHVREGTPDPRTTFQMARDSHQPREHNMRSRTQSGASATRSEDSWIEVSSQPSTSSLSSIATNDDIVTTGLRVEGQQPGLRNHRSRRRRLEHLAAATAPPVNYATDPSEASSSQDEYEESSSESDRVMTSSNEDITTRSREPLFLRAGSTSASDAVPSSDEEDDDDDTSTALGMRVSSSPFVPQPNAFSHPPAAQAASRSRAADVPLPSPTVLSTSSRRTATRHNSYSSVRSARRQQHSPYNMISPSYQADHDAALRASLSTLLSYATAARGLPKNDTQPNERSPSAAQPSTFRLVPESVAMGEESGAEESRAPGPSADNQAPAPSRVEKNRRPATTAPSNTSSSPKQKRRTSSSKDRSSAHASKKSRRSNLADSVSNISPTLMTWVISAGVVVLFSAISFSAGYALGREVGRTEGSLMGDAGAGALSGAGTSAGCGREAVKGGLKRLRWGAAATSSISA